MICSTLTCAGGLRQYGCRRHPSAPIRHCGSVVYGSYWAGCCWGRATTQLLFLYGQHCLCSMLLPCWPVLVRIDLPCSLYRAVAHFPWVCAFFVPGPSASGSHMLGLPDLLWALRVSLYKPRCPVVRSPFGDGSRVGIHFPLALPVVGGVWISSADTEASTDAF